MKYSIDCTNYKVPLNSKEDWEQIGEPELLLETYVFKEALDFFNNYEVESFADYSKNSNFTYPAFVKAISFMAFDGKCTDEPEYKYLVKM
jgi:hypothetical protein